MLAEGNGIAVDQGRVGRVLSGPCAVAGLCLLMCTIGSGVGGAVVVVDTSVSRGVVSDTAFGIHSSVYANQWPNAQLPARLSESGVTMLRYPGGGYADAFHWSITRASWENGVVGGGLSPWWGEPNNFGYVAGGADFANFVRVLSALGGAGAIITVNYGSAQKFVGGRSLVPDFGGQPGEAAAWVAYANGDPGLFGTARDVPLGTDRQGNNWLTAGYWAKLRASTPAEYRQWAGAAGLYNAYHEFLAIGRVQPVGIRYWEIGNETFGSGYYDWWNNGTNCGYSLNYHVPYDGTVRYGNTNLSPAFYGAQVSSFAAAMRAVDPEAKIGAVVTTPPGDYAWDAYQGGRWTPEVLAKCAREIDFVIVHWYPWAGENADGSNLLRAVRSELPVMINGQTAGPDTGTNAGLRDWIGMYRPEDHTNVQIFVTEFGYMGSLAGGVRGPVTALFCADAYATWLELGVANVCWLEMSSDSFLGDLPSLNPGAAYHAIRLVSTLYRPGDFVVAAASADPCLRVHASLRRDNRVCIMLINTDPKNPISAELAIGGVPIAGPGWICWFGATNFVSNSVVPVSPPAWREFACAGNAFELVVPAYTMALLVLPVASNPAPGSYSFSPACATEQVAGFDRPVSAVSGAGVGLVRNWNLPWQQWVLDQMGPGTYSLRLGMNTNLALCVSGSAGSGSVVPVLASFPGGSACQWRVESAGPGFYRIVAGAGTNLVLQADPAGSVLVLAEWDDGPSQKWRMHPVGAGSHLPVPWLGADVGDVRVSGLAKGSGTGFAVAGSGLDIGGTNDQFHFVFRLARGDCELRARVLSIQNTDPNAKAGVMIRETLAADSPFAMLAIRPAGYGMVFRWRTSPGAGAFGSSLPGVSAPYWLRILRDGDIVRAYRSGDGLSWISVGNVNIPMGEDAFVGLVVNSRADGVLCAAAFEGVTVNCRAELMPIPTRSVAPGTYLSIPVPVSDIDVPIQTLAWSMPSSPAGASMDPPGIVHWRPGVDRAGTTNLFVVVVTDNGVPQMTATQTFLVHVSSMVRPTLDAVRTEQIRVNLVINGISGPDYAIEASTNLHDWEVLDVLSSPSLPVQWTDPGQDAFPLRFYRVRPGPPWD